MNSVVVVNNQNLSNMQILGESNRRPSASSSLSGALNSKSLSSSSSASNYMYQLSSSVSSSLATTPLSPPSPNPYPAKSSPNLAVKELGKPDDSLNQVDPYKNVDDLIETDI